MAQPVSPLRRVLHIRREEWPQALLMFGYFFLVITTFWILKPLKKALFVQYYAAEGLGLLGWQLSAPQAEQLAKVANMFIALAAAAAFAILSRSFRRHRLTFIFAAFCGGSCLAFIPWLADPGEASVWSFYFFGDLYSTVMVASFFAFLNDSVAPDQAKRLYGLIGLGGVAGGAFGSTVLSAWLDDAGLAGWLLICALLSAAVIVIAGAAGRRFERTAPRLAEEQAERTEPAKRAALAGAQLVFRSRYLLAIAAIVGLYEMVSTIMDFQFTVTVVHYLSGPDIGRHFALVFAITNWVALLVQLFLTSFVMTRFGVGAALLMLPVMALAGSAGFFAAPLLLTGSFLNTADNGFSYSINQSAKEALYVPASRREKYQAKAFIDMFVQRFAKALGVALNLAMTMAIAGLGGARWLSLLTLAILAVWMRTAVYAGAEFRRKSERIEESQAPAAQPVETAV